MDKRLLTASSLVLVACATAPRGPGSLDARAVAAARAPDAKEVELEVAADGHIDELAVERSDGSHAPEAVRKLALATYPGGTLVEYELEVTGGGALAHEVEVKTADGKQCEVAATDAGALRYTECRLAPGELPAAVAKAIGDAEVKEAEVRKTPGAADEYRVEGKTGGRTYYWRVAPDGSLVGKSVVVEAEVVVPAE